MTRVRIGFCGVDAGMLMVGDPCYFVGKDAAIHNKCESWAQACSEVFCPDGVDRDTPMDVYGLGVAIGTTNGDGCYPVYLETADDGRRRLIVELD
jgi:hypothetical protein